MLPLLLASILLTPGPSLLYERLDLYDPVSYRYLGSEQTWFGPDGRRLRVENGDGEGEATLLFFLLHDEGGREIEGRYFESDPNEVNRERFEYTEDGRLKRTLYLNDAGEVGQVTESDLDENGREISKRYFRTDGSQYGEEDVLWDAFGRSGGWHFRYTERDGGARFSYVYEEAAEPSEWTYRTRYRDGEPERVEVRSVHRAGEDYWLNPVRFAAERVSGSGSETSPCFSADGTTMVFARYSEDWNQKTPYLARLDSTGWRAAPVEALGPVYNLCISPDGGQVVYAVKTGETPHLKSSTWGPEGWSPGGELPGLETQRGSYPNVTADGSLLFYDSDGPNGAGIYGSAAGARDYSSPTALYIPETGDAFDAYMLESGQILVTRCTDDACGPADNGIFRMDPYTGKGAKLASLRYFWGATPVEALGLLVFTDGEDILAVPLNSVMGRP